MLTLIVAVLSTARAEAPARQTETLTTRDGVELVADLYAPAEAAEAPAGVVLLHMIPPHWDRSSWPASFIGELQAKGWAVCVPDRRGAGDSKGIAREAYEGDTGRYDVEACVKRLQQDGLGKLAVIGASNGTTTALDYTAWAKTEEELPVPAALGFMTGGGYTENQTKLSEAKGIPAVFTFSTAEAKWSTASKGADPQWVHREYAGGDHGTKMFEAKPEVAQHLIAFLAEHL
jgi:pimeloyl-ACP methyl ester carboxylesterase